MRPADDAQSFFARLDVTGSRRDLVAVGGTLDAAALVAAYRAGCFPWPSSGEDEQALERQTRRLVRRRQVPVLPGPDALVPWCSPDPRAVLLADQVVVRRSLRARLRSCGWTATVDAAFDDVVAGCADRESTWITARMRDGYAELHRAPPGPLAGAHSVEVWDGDELIGGTFGVRVGGVFSADSQFMLRSGAAKVAVACLVRRVAEAGGVAVDVQHAGDHATLIGAVPVPRADYLALLALHRDDSGTLPADRLPARRLAEPGPARLAA